VRSTERNPAPTPPVSLVRLTAYFLQLGALGFGGPIALVATMQRELVEERRWLTRQDYLDGLALAQLSPGPLAAQVAIYIGYLQSGVLGATVVGAAFVAPSFVIVVALAAAYTRWQGLPWIQAAFYGIGPAVIAVIARAAWRLARSVVGRDPLLITIFAALAATTAITEREIVPLIFGCGIVTLIAKNLRARALPAFVLVASAAAPAVATLPQIALFFAKSGLVVFGSGLAIVPFLHGAVVQQLHWLTEQQFLDAVAVALLTPGPVVITVAFIGYLVRGPLGAVAAAAGVFLPVYAVVLLVGPWYRRVAQNQQLRSFVRGVTAAASGALAGAVVVLSRRTLHDATGLALAAVALLVLLRYKIAEHWIIAAAALLGLFLRHF
jgi:chromate transporter